MINIPKNTQKQKTFPAFGVVVCPVVPGKYLQMSNANWTELSAAYRALEFPASPPPPSPPKRVGGRLLFFG